MTKDNKANRLIHEKSPYLLQHAHNPVDWYAWGEEAFAKAKAENKPIFLSVGYSTCHWCHVMAHQSFEDNEVAKLLNERFISIKVDREERPDVDSIYMRVCQMLTGQGGWPLSVFLTPDQKPFFAGTYFPKKSMYGKPGFIDVITQLYDKYIEDPQRISEVADKLVEGLNEKAQSTTQGSELNVNVLQKTYKQLSKSFDGIYGGFGAAPKFPIPHMLTFLNRYYHWSKEENALFFVEKTLNGMANGGIFDHVGFGFARYSTDAMWLVPHFEKMLYDNALLITAYTEAYQLTKNERYKKVCETTIEFLEREMISPEGGFYSALDADTEGVEGKYYVWDKGEILHTLGTEFGDLYCEVYDISEDGNFEEKNIPNLIHTNIDKIRSKYGLTMSELEGKLEIARKKLLEERSLRTYPHVDDKILTSWNAMMIAALAKAGKVFENQQYFDLASNAMQFIEASLTENGRIMVRYRDGEVKNKGYIDDYAFLLWAYLELYETSLELSCLQSAKKIAEHMMDLFWDSEDGGFFFTGSDGEALIVREKELYDGALPSGNSVAAVQLVRLSNLTGNEEYTERVQSMVRKFATEVEAYGSGHTFFLQAFLMLQLPRKEIVVIGPKDDQNRQKLVSALQQSFTTTNTLLVAERPEEFAGIAEYATHYRMLDNKTTVYVCENFTCNQPTTNIDEVLKSLNL